MTDEWATLTAGFGTEIDASDSTGRTRLHHAAFHGYSDIVEGLVEAGADVNAPDVKGWTPLLVAVCRGHVECVSTLIDFGADVTSPLKHCLKPVRNGPVSSLPIHFAAMKGDISMMELLLSCGASLKTVDGAGMHVLHYVCARGHVNALRWLLSVQKVKPDVIDSNHRSALHALAVASGSVACAKLLLKHFPASQIRASDAWGLDPLTLAEVCGHKELKELLSAGSLQNESAKPTRAFLLGQAAAAVAEKAAALPLKFVPASRSNQGEGRPEDLTMASEGDVEMPQAAAAPAAQAAPRFVEPINPPGLQANLYSDSAAPRLIPGEPMPALSDSDMELLLKVTIALQEPKYRQLERIIRRLGAAKLVELHDETLAIEETGGQATADGLRRKTFGGVFFSLLKKKTDDGLISKEDYKWIRMEDRERELAKRKAKRQTTGMNKPVTNNTTKPTPKSAGKAVVAKTTDGKHRFEHKKQHQVRARKA